MVRIGVAEGTARAPCFGVSLSAALALVPRGDGRRGPARFRSARLKCGPGAQDAGLDRGFPCVAQGSGAARRRAGG